VIKSADWLIDLGPDAGDEGGEIVAEGPPEQVAACPNSHTGRALREILPSRTHSRRLAPA
jgi:excinuclease ABC subunit A